MSVPGQGSLANPTLFPRDVGVPGAPGPLSHGVTPVFGLNLSSIPGLDANLTTSYDRGTTYGNGTNDTNGRMVTTICTELEGSAPFDNGQHQLLFLFANAGEGPFACRHKSMSLSRLNYLLTTPEYRTRYGDEPTYKRLFEDWRFIGVQQSQNTSPETYRTDHYVTVFIGKRTRIPNLWAAMQSNKFGLGSVRVNDHLYLIARRYRWKSEIMKQFGAARDHWKYDEEQKKRQMEKERTKKTNKRRKRQANGTTAAAAATAVAVDNDSSDESSAIEDHDATAGDGEGFYWQFEVYVSDDKSPPPQCLYVDDNGVGAYIFIGFVTDIFGNTSASMKHIQWARDALHPTSNSSEYLTPLLNLSDIEVQLRIRG